LNLTCRENQSTGIDFSNFLSVLANRFLSSLITRSLSFQCVDDTQSSQTQGLAFDLWTAVIQDFSSSRTSQLKLVLTWPSSQLHYYVKALTCAFDAMSLSFLTQLQISTEDYIDSQTLVKTFGKLSLLERVNELSYSPESFFEALVYKTKAAEKPKTAYCNVPFPKLRYINLDGTHFLGINQGSISVDMVLDYLMERCERDAEIQALRLDNCFNISSNDVERLKEIVVEVIWDGVEQKGYF